MHALRVIAAIAVIALLMSVLAFDAATRDPLGMHAALMPSDVAETTSGGLGLSSRLIVGDTAGCGLCTTDDDCGGAPHKCCQGDCPSGQKKCYNFVSTCP